VRDARTQAAAPAADSLDVPSCRPNHFVLWGVVLFTSAFTYACGASTSKSTVAPPPPAMPVVVPTGPTLQDARNAQRQGRPAEAIRLYDAIAAGRQVDPPTRLEALSRGAFLRLAVDSPQRDLPKARAMLTEVARLDAQYTTAVPTALLVPVLQEVETLRARSESLDAALKDRTRQGDRSTRQQQQQQDQKMAVLRTENRQLREDIKTLQADLARKEEALRRTAEKLLNTPPELP
jgi:hypothetical protein